jgi:hypothetical protein
MNFDFDTGSYYARDSFDPPSVMNAVSPTMTRTWGEEKAKRNKKRVQASSVHLPVSVPLWRMVTQSLPTLELRQTEGAKESAKPSCAKASAGGERKD